MINNKVKLNKKDYHPCCNSYLAEVSRKNMVGKSKKQSPERYAKKSNYHALKYDGIDVNKLLTDDQFVVVVPVGKYECTIAFNGVIEELGTMLKMQKHGNEYSANINLQMCIRVLQRTIDNKDILVDCSCPDFVYRFAFFATKFGYKYGKPETRPSKITNPHDDKGSVCKHLLALLSSKRWLVKLATTFNTIVHDHLYEIQDMLGMWDEDAFVNRSGVHSRTTVNRMRQSNAQQKSFDKPMVVDMSDDLDLGESVEETTSKERVLK